ncbi:MAG: flagellar hook-basal body complex protein [Alphaproteobacteria bacterium]
MVAYSMFAPSIAALQSYSQSFDSVSENIANARTPGYKNSRIGFQESVVAASGSKVSSTFLGSEPFRQVLRTNEGVVIGTDNKFDAALTGHGMFVTSPSLTFTEQDLEFTDAGQFRPTLVGEVGVSEEVYLTDIKGNFVLGWPFDPATNTFNIDTNSTASLEPIRIDPDANQFDAVATTAARLIVNLPATAETGDTFDFDLPIFDGTGDDDGIADEQQVILSFVKTATNNTWDLTVSGGGGTVNTPAVQPVSVVFDAEGQIQSVGGTAGGDLPLDITWANSGATNTFTVDLDRSTQISNFSDQSDLFTNGNSDGSLSSVFYGDDGNVIGSFSNGLTRPLARFAVADFVEPNRLDLVGATHYRQSVNSGEIQLIDLANTDRVFFVAEALEESTTDIANEFTQLLVTQRAYSTAATNLRTVDEMMRTATELKS